MQALNFDKSKGDKNQASKNGCQKIIKEGGRTREDS
jgi:hypothetical protein